MLGGIIAAPIAAWLVKVMPSYLLGGGFIILTNIWTVLKIWPINNIAELFIYMGVFIFWIFSIALTIKKNRHISRN
ncbi:hypothetical protein PMEGAPL125_53330 [Priestia megaterium]